MKWPFFLLLCWVASPGWGDALNLTPAAGTAAAGSMLLDPDDPNAIVPAPNPLPELPLGLQLPPTVASRSRWRGVRCGVTEPRFAVFQSVDKWRSFWQKGLAPYAAVFKDVPEINFRSEMVVGVFLGERQHPHFEIEIVSARPELARGEPDTMVVRYREIERMAGVFNPPFRVQPFDLIRVPVWPGRLRFEKQH